MSVTSRAICNIPSQLKADRKAFDWHFLLPSRIAGARLSCVMLKAFERALNPCKPPGLSVRFNRPAWENSNDCFQRVLGWVLLCLALLTLAFLADGPVGRMLLVRPDTFWRHFAVYASKAGEGWVMAVGGILGSTVLFMFRRFHASRGVFLVACTSLITGATATIFRSLIGRTRPGAHELQGFYGVWHDSHWIIGKYEFGAFPSGHVATVVGLAAAVWLINRRLGLVTAGYALLVSWSRIALGCHHFSDEIAATIVGIVGARLVFAHLGPTVCALGLYLQYVRVRLVRRAWSMLTQSSRGLGPSPRL